MGCTLRDAKVDQGCRPSCDRLGTGESFLLEFDALAHAEARGAGPMRLPIVADEAFVEVNMTFDHAGENQASAKIAYFADCAVALRGRRDGDDLAAADGDVDKLAVGQPCVLEECLDGCQIQISSFLCRHDAVG